MSLRSTALAIEPDPSAVAVVCAAAVAKPQSAAVKTKGLVASADGDGENSPGRAASKFAATVLKLNPQPPGFVATEIQSVRGIAHSIKFSLFRCFCARRCQSDQVARAAVRTTNVRRAGNSSSRTMRFGSTRSPPTQKQQARLKIVERTGSNELETSPHNQWGLATKLSSVAAN